MRKGDDNLSDLRGDFRELQARFINGVDSMSKEDAERFLTLLQADECAPFRDDRMNRLRRHIDGLKRLEDADNDRSDRITALALEDKATKDRWLELGATWRVVEKRLTIWEYGGTKFYSWLSGVHIEDGIEGLRVADVRLAELVSENEAEGVLI